LPLTIILALLEDQDASPDCLCTTPSVGAAKNTVTATNIEAVAASWSSHSTGSGYFHTPSLLGTVLLLASVAVSIPPAGICGTCTVSVWYIQQVLDGLCNYISGLVQTVSVYIQQVLDGLCNYISGLVQTVSVYIQQVLDGLCNYISGLVQTVSVYIQQVSEAGICIWYLHQVSPRSICPRREFSVTSREFSVTSREFSVTSRHIL
jgi:hypothetical protein